MRTLQHCHCFHRPASSQPGGSKPPSKHMQQLLQRLQASSATVETLSPAQTTSQHIPDDAFLSSEEQSTLSTEQAAFMVRKRKAALGLGPIMPESSNCPCCSGIGTLICHQCNGTGYNATNKAEEIFEANEAKPITVNNGLVQVQWLFVQNGPCWLCRGKQHVGCADCSGTGINGGVDRFTGD